MENQIIHTFKKNETEEVRISLKPYNGKPYLDIRVFFYSEKAGEFLPKKKGVTLSAEFLGELKTALSRAEEVIGQPAAV